MALAIPVAWFVILVVSLAGTTAIQAIEAEYVWEKVDALNAPSPRRSHAMAYDPATDAVVLFGGFGNGTHFGDTWILNMTDNSWMRKNPIVSPTPRAATTLVYDNVNSRLLMFGGFGFGHSIVSNDTWAYSTAENAWSNLDSKNPPSERASYGMAFDSQRAVALLFGGFTEQGYFSDLWEYDPAENAWREIVPNGNVPAARGAMGFVYDEENDVFVMFGGFSETGFFSDTWVFHPDSDTWEEKSPQSHPPPLRTRMVYDSDSDQSIFFGGDVMFAETEEAPVAPYGSVWAYDYQQNTWQELLEANVESGPSRRSLNGIVFDSARSSILIFGGTDALIDSENFVGREFGDTWVLSSDPTPSIPAQNPASLTVPIIVLILGSAGAAAAILLFRRNRSGRQPAPSSPS
jgi:N-acetylneuraminic acid mutarotase